MSVAADEGGHKGAINTLFLYTREGKPAIAQTTSRG